MASNKNSTFCGADPTWANACVGNNGQPGYSDYEQGFSAGANLLIEQVILGEGLTLSVDSLIYPVCFNMRHSVELRLKGAIEELGHVASAKKKFLRFAQAAGVLPSQKRLLGAPHTKSAPRTLWSIQSFQSQAPTSYRGYPTSSDIEQDASRAIDLRDVVLYNICIVSG
ncbi:hypothetical protein [Pseudomonas triticifolii]|uniref:Uncharacterized protein n=1 Tax=Pseudomonas triticifolii TaxID=2762592 RepID=A0ABR7BJ57_9PSED|nr:hypothetical protein [Pseudomonas triticifolii]MBC3957179.1 hypothetical protein [Pseudomonas triticifolii]